MKILQLIQKPQLRGAEIFACQLSNHLLEEGHEVRMISLLSGEARMPFRNKIESLDLSLSKRFFDFAGWKKLAKVIEDFQPDIIQSNAGDTLKVAALSKLFYHWKAPIIFRNANLVSGFVNTWSKRMFNGFLVKQVSYVISVSELCRLDFIKTYNVSPARTRMVPIGIEPHKLDAELPADVRKYFEGHTVLVNVASLVPEKNHEALIRLAANFAKQKLNVRILILGDGKLRGILQQKIEDLDLRNYIVLLGYRNDVQSILQHANGFVLPSNIEGLPAVILEAFYCKVPVVATNVGGISEVVVNEQTGWLVERGNDTELLNATREVLADPAKRALVTENAYRLVTGNFANRAIAHRFGEAYKDALEKESITHSKS